MESRRELSTAQVPDYIESESREKEAGAQDQLLGAKVLSLAHYESSHKPIVESSFNKALKKGEKLLGNNSERRNFSYLSRLDNLIKKYGNGAEYKLWQASIKDDLLIQYDNIPESYWNTKKQELRDNGYGNYELTEDYKRYVYEKERELQKESLKKWVNYLGDEHSPYPLWFKVYAWDGMTKMGRYNKRKGRYEARNKTTVAPYLDPDAEVLAGVFDVINRYYGNDEKEFYTEDGERNIRLEQIVQSGSFPKIFSAIRSDIAPIVEPPEKTEDIHGEWVEYEMGEEDDIARAARGTGWCVASSSVGRHYLEYGTYGNYDDNDIDNDDDNDNVGDDDGGYNRQNQAKFILFHLVDQEKNKLAKNACAAIRLDPDGIVAEISGLKEGQALNDSLVPIVEEKVRSLPGGESFLAKFADKNKLIALDRKMKNDEDLNIEELEFLYEMHRPIQVLDTYNDVDPRISELKQKYNIAYALDAGLEVDSLVSSLYESDTLDDLDIEDLGVIVSHGVNIDDLVSKLGFNYVGKNAGALIDYGANIDHVVSKSYVFEIVKNLDFFITRGANIDNLLSKIGRSAIAENLDTFITHDVDIDKLVSNLDPLDIVENLDTLIAHGAKIDIDNLVSNMRSSDIVENLDTLIAHGAKIDIDKLVSRISSFGIAKHLDSLIAHGANIDKLVSRISPFNIAKHLDSLIAHGAKIDIDKFVSKAGSVAISTYLDSLIAHGADIDNLVSNLSPRKIAEHLDTLLTHGANIDNLASNMDPSDIVENLDTLIAHGAKIDIDKLVSQIGSIAIAEHLDSLIAHGANLDNLVSVSHGSVVLDNLDTLITHGANIDIDDVVSRADSLVVAKHLDFLIAHGADIDNLVSNLASRKIAEHLDTLLTHGANIDNLASNMDSSDIVENLDSFIAHGANIDNLVSNMDSIGIVENLDTLITHGVKIDIDNLVSNLASYRIVEHLDILIAYGANIDNLVSNMDPSDIVENLDTLIAHGAKIDY